MRRLVLSIALMLAATPALAIPVALVDGPMDDDGQVTLG